MEQANFRKYIIWGQVGFWTALFMINFLYEIDFEEPLSAVLFGLTATAHLIPIVYIHYKWLLPLFVERRLLLYFISTTLLISFWIIIYFLVDRQIPSAYDNEEGDLLGGFIYYFLFAAIIVGMSSLFYFVEAWYEHFKRAALLKNEKLQTELSLLKSQINPHFLFNTLNNIYSYAQTGNEKTAPMLERLSSILRFMVYDGSEDNVDLNKEIGAIEDLLEIHKMKNSKQQNITFIQQGVKGYHLIAPLILVNFVENACKHSDTISNPKGFLKVVLSVDEGDNCDFSIQNTFKHKNKINSKYEGLGLVNIKKRLALQYGEDHSFSEQKEGTIYQLKLNIPLERKK